MIINIVKKLIITVIFKNVLSTHLRYYVVQVCA